MATEFTLRRSDGKSFGTFDEAQQFVRRHFPNVKFGWTTSGAEKLRVATERGITLPPQLLEALKTLPSLLEGVAANNDFHVHFGLGHEEPVACLYVTPRGNDEELKNRLSALEAEAGSLLSIAGSR